MKSKAFSALVVLVSSCLLPNSMLARDARTVEESQAAAAASSSQSPKTPGFRLEDGTPIRLRLQRTISSADAQVDDTVDFDVLEEVKVNDMVVIPKGSVALGTVTEAQSKRRMARGGKLNVNIDSVRLADGEKAALRAVKDVKGGGHTGAMTGAIVATSIVFFPAAPFFLFMHGKDITIPKGTEITAYVNGDFNLDPSKFTGRQANEPPPAAPASASTAQPAAQSPGPPGELVFAGIKSTPDGADINVDGKYVGSTPSTVRLTPGDHTISIGKSGFRTWERTITVSPGGSVTINATLEAVSLQLK
jgi:PEGA domain-containing protein